MYIIPYIGNKLIQMKTTLLLVGLFCTVLVHAQCNAGSDRVSCPDDPDANAVQLGGNPTASFGTSPYAYAWSMAPYTLTTGLTLYASDLLSDTTISNPTVLDRNLGTLSFFLRVTDAVGTTCTDTVTIAFSNFAINLSSLSYTINQGDSIFLNSGSNVVGSTYPITHFQWTPSSSLSQSNVQSGFWAKPLVTTSYAVTCTDSAGCSIQAPPYYHITVNPLSTAEPEPPHEVLIFPNPAKDKVNIQLPANMRSTSYALYSATGHLVAEGDAVPADLDLSQLSSGTYFLEVKHQEGTVREKLVVNH